MFVDGLAVFVGLEELLRSGAVNNIPLTTSTTSMTSTVLLAVLLRRKQLASLYVG